MIMNPEPVVDQETVRQLLSLPENTLSVADGAGEMPPVSGDTTVRYKNLAFREARNAFEHDFLLARLSENKGNISLTAEQIGLERSHLHRKIKSLEIEIK